MTPPPSFDRNSRPVELPVIHIDMTVRRSVSHVAAGSVLGRISDMSASFPPNSQLTESTSW